MSCPIDLVPGDERTLTRPVTRPEIFELYKKLRSMWWTPEVIRYDTDRADYDRLSEDERRPIYYINAFFANADSFVAKNLTERFMAEIPIYEVQLFYSLQIPNENIHAESYLDLICIYVTDPVEREIILDSIRRIPIIGEMAKYTNAIITDNVSFADRMTRMIAVEGILFSMCFAIIYWFAKRGLCRGLCHLNRLVAEDEGVHTLANISIYKMARDKLKPERVCELFEEAVTIGRAFIREALPTPLFDSVAGPMNATLLSEYAECRVNNIMHLMGIQPAYPESRNPFPFMDMLAMPNQSNFFEVVTSDYHGADPDSDDEKI